MQSTAYSAGPHLLNLEPQPGGAPPVQRSRWCNLGLWRDGCVEFAPACAALARALADAVDLGPSDSVLDVGQSFACSTGVNCVERVVRKSWIVDRGLASPQG